ncbi:MAG: histidine kinase [Saprospiraceae bacterium]|nr:histidine kinase [Saprospiraceae bacterium]
MRHFLPILWFVLSGILCVVGAQTPPAGFLRFTADDGLPSSEVHEILQDRQGYLWFATDNGVSRYNGYRFENFGTLQGLDDPVVFYLQEDRQGRVWMQGMSARLYYFEKDSIHTFAGNSALDSLKSRIAISGDYRFYVDTLGQVYNSIPRVGLMRFSSSGEGEFLIKDHSLSAYLVENRAINVLSYNIPSKEFLQPIDDPWGAKDQWQFTIFQDRQKSKYILPKGELPVEMYTWCSADHTLVVANLGYLFGFREGKLVWQIPFPEQVADIYQNSQGEIYLGLGRRKGMRHYQTIADLQHNRFETMLEGYSVSHVIEDRQGGYWFATTEAGVFYRPNAHMSIFNQASGLPNDYVTSIALKNEHEAFVGLDGSGLVKVNAFSKEVSPFLPYAGQKIFDLAFDSKREILWATVDNSSLNYFLHGKWRPIIDPIASATHKREVGFAARHFHLSSDLNTLWGAYHIGFAQIDPGLQKVVFSSKYDLQQEAPYQTRTLDACTTFDKRSWIANIYGLFELRDSQLITPKQKHPAFQTRIEAIEELPDSTLVIGSKGYGLVFWKGDRTASLTEADGLTANMIETLTVDNKGNLWAGTLNGLNKVRWDWEGRFEIEKITTAHGLPSNEITDAAVWGNTVWVGTTKGLAYFQSSKPSLISPAPILSAVLANRRSLDLTTPVRLAYSEKNLTINFFAINFKLNGKIPYRYRFNKGEWVQTFNTSLNFPSLPTGDRHFEVQAQNEDGEWSESAGFQFYIRPPWWQTWWFWSAIALSSLLIVLAAARYRISQVRHEEQLKRAFYKEISEKEMEALRSQMNPHFIFNCLNSINNFIVRNDSAQAAGYITKFSRLMRLVLDNSRSQRVPLEKEIEALRLYLELEAMRFDDKFRYEIWVDDEIDQQFCQIPPMLIQPYIENAIWHGLMHKPEGGSVVVDVRPPTDNKLLVEITDDGVGRARAAELESKSTLQRKSYGGLITEERLRILNPDKPDENKVSIHDLVDANGKACGTRVVLEIPV